MLSTRPAVCTDLQQFRVVQFKSDGSIPFSHRFIVLSVALAIASKIRSLASLLPLAALDQRPSQVRGWLVSCPSVPKLSNCHSLYPVGQDSFIA